MKKVTQISSKSGDASMMSVEGALMDALAEVSTPDTNSAFHKGKKCLILCLDDDDNEYTVSFFQAGMKMSECVALCEVVKTDFLTRMNRFES